MDALDKFIKKYEGVPNVGNTKDNKGECTGLVMLWIAELGLSHIWGHAKDIYAHADGFDWMKIPNKKDVYPKRGDVICWSSLQNNVYGHVAIVTSSSDKDDTFTVFEQNNPIGKAPSIRTFKNWTGVIGWLTPRDAVLPPIADEKDKKIKMLENGLDKKARDITDLEIKLNELKQKYDGLENKYNTELRELEFYRKDNERKAIYIDAQKTNIKELEDLIDFYEDERKKQQEKKTYAFSEIFAIIKNYIRRKLNER